MKKIVFIALILGCTTFAHSQNRIGLEFGLTNTSFSLGGGNPDNTYKHNSDFEPTVSMNYLRKIDRHVYIGFILGLQAHSFYFSNTVLDNRVDVYHKSTYFMMSPVLDLGLGRQQLMHINISLGLGFLTNGNETTNEYTNGNWTTPSNSYNSVSNISGFIMRPTFGLKQHVPLSKFWHFTLNEGFGFLVTDLTHAGNLNTIHPGFVSLQMGVMRKFHRPKTQSADK